MENSLSVKEEGVSPEGKASEVRNYLLQTAMDVNQLQRPVPRTLQSGGGDSFAGLTFFLLFVAVFVVAVKYRHL